MEDNKFIDKVDNILQQELGKQEAKIYAYEAILSNSNFKMAVVKHENKTVS